MSGTFMGRKAVKAMQREMSNPERKLAVDWLVASYLACGQARIQLGDWQTARSDVWAACMYSENSSLDALQCMLTVCENTDDLLGELNTLKSIQQLLSTTDGADAFSEEELSIDKVQEQIRRVEAKLQSQFKP
eukprot:scaffold2917_cov191-Amphora_coffeaeformis.AAC.14